MFLHHSDDHPTYDNDILNRKINLKVIRHYDNIGKIPGVLLEETKRRKLLQSLNVDTSFLKMNAQDQKEGEEEEKGEVEVPIDPQVQKTLSNLQKDRFKQSQQIPERYRVQGKTSSALSLVNALANNQNAIALRSNKLVYPKWHAPWKLYRVISGHQGWVRCLAMDPMNKFFVSGSNDRTIKFWDLVEGKLLVTLTGHINTVRGLVMSSKHPYLFSCGEDKKILCWDLEQNKVVRHYHGHLSGVYSIAIHPQLDLIVTGGRDSTARVWDMRTCQQVHILGGHGNTVDDIVCQSDEPQIITASHDRTIRLWDIRTGATLHTLTYHKKGVRSLAIHPEEYTFASAGSDKIRVWKCPDGEQLRTIPDHNAVINSIAINRDNVLASGGDNGSLYFFDWASGYNFQQIKTTVQPGSLSCEAGIFKLMFDKSSLRMITAECDKSIKIWKEDEEATPETHPINFQPGEK